MISVQPIMVTFSATTSVCGKGGEQWEQGGLNKQKEQTHVLRTWGAHCRMRGGMVEDQGGVGIQLDVVSFSEAICARGKDGERWQQALTLMDQMQAFSVQPNVITFNAEIRVCNKSGGWWVWGCCSLDLWHLAFSPM